MYLLILMEPSFYAESLLLCLHLYHSTALLLVSCDHVCSCLWLTFNE